MVVMVQLTTTLHYNFHNQAYVSPVRATVRRIVADSLRLRYRSAGSSRGTRLSKS